MLIGQMETNKTATGTRFNGKCSCGSRFSTLVVAVYGEFGPVQLYADTRMEYRSDGVNFAKALAEKIRAGIVRATPRCAS